MKLHVSNFNGNITNESCGAKPVNERHKTSPQKKKKKSIFDVTNQSKLSLFFKIEIVMNIAKNNLEIPEKS